MTEQWSVPAAVVVGALALLVLGTLAGAVLLRRAAGRRRRLAAEAARTAETVAALRERLAAMETRLGEVARSSADREYVITGLAETAGRTEDPAGDDGATAGPPARTVPAPLFADLVLRESVVQAASLAAGLRRALAPETRARVRVEMRREVKRARKQRKADLREARREWEARARAGARETQAPEPARDSAA